MPSGSKDDIVRKYDVSLEVAEETETEDNSDEKTATLYVCYYKNDDDKVCQYVWSGDTELLDLEDYYARNSITNLLRVISRTITTYIRSRLIPILLW